MRSDEGFNINRVDLDRLLDRLEAMSPEEFDDWFQKSDQGSFAQSLRERSEQIKARQKALEELRQATKNLRPEDIPKELQGVEPPALPQLLAG